jgi:hypothetical protein
MMFSPLSIFTGPYAMLAKWGVIALLALGCMGFGALKMHQHDQKKYDALELKHNLFVTQTKVVGEQAALKADAQRKQDKLDKEKADVENAKSVADLNARVVQLRRERDSARSSIVPPAPPGSSRPELACFDRAELERANGELLAAIRGGADKGSKDTVDLNTAKRWAQNPTTD